MGRNKTSKGVRYRDATDEELRAEVQRFTGLLSRGLETMNEYQWAIDDEDNVGRETERGRQAYNRAKKDAETVGSFLTSLRLYCSTR